MRPVAILALLLVTSTAMLPVVGAATAETWTDGIWDVESGMPQEAFAADAAVHAEPVACVPLVTSVVATVTVGDDGHPASATHTALPARAPPGAAAPPPTAPR